MTRVARGQLLIGTHEEGQPNRVFAVTGTSFPPSGNAKAWLHAWDPRVEGDAREHEIVTTARFEGGEIAPPWRLLDIYDTAAMTERVDQALKARWALKVRMEHPPSGLGLACLQALFRGPS